MMASTRIVLRRPELCRARPPDRSITCRQRYAVRTGRSHDEPIGGVAVKSRGQAVNRDYDVSIEGQDRQNS
jgi:hypothetical protein